MEGAALGERLGFERLAERHHLVSEESALETLLDADQVRRARWRLVDQVLALAALEAKRAQEARDEEEGSHAGR